jgi:hypothetical protein
VIVVEGEALKRLVILNSHARKRQEMVTVRISTYNVKVYRYCIETGNCQS